MRTIFITYNPNSEFEQTLAIRLHTIGATNGFRMYLPDRFNSEDVLDDETKSRISKSDYVVLFSISPLSEIVRQEIEYAFGILGDKSRIIVIYDKHRGKNLSGGITTHFTPIYIDQFNSDPSAVLAEILKIVHSKEAGRQAQEVQKLRRESEKSGKENDFSLAALLGVGLMFLVLGSAALAKK
jgi:hypothetical protein